MAEPALAPPPAGLTKDLSVVSEAIRIKQGQPSVVRAIGLDDPDLWPSAPDFADHFCLQRLLARLSRENIVAEAVGFNYDCATEAGLAAEGFMFNPRTEPGGVWRDHATVISDAITHADLTPSGDFTLYKAHGCSARYRQVARVDERQAADSIIACTSQLNHWRNDLWMRDAFRDRARSHVLLLIGFAGNDPVIQSAIQQTLTEVYSSVPPNGLPRLVAIDYEPDTVPLRGLINAGLGGQPPAADVVTQVRTADGTSTAAMLVLLTESLAVKLDTAFAARSYALPTELDSRLAALVVSSPVMMRWSYLLREPAQNEFTQRINLRQAAQRGYVPLTVVSDSTARALHTRHELRQRLARNAPESSQEALADHGFIVENGRAYLPVGLDHKELIASCRPGGQADSARTTLAHPAHLDCVLVSDGSAGLTGVSLDTGREVAIP